MKLAVRNNVIEIKSSPLSSTAKSILIPTRDMPRNEMLYSNDYYQSAHFCEMAWSDVILVAPCTLIKVSTSAVRWIR